MSKLRNTIYMLGFLSIIFTVSTVFCVVPQKEISNIENRKLAQKPKMNIENILNGNYFKEFDSYVNDQIPGRDTFIKYYTKINMDVLKKKKINDVVIGKDGYLLSYSPYPFDNYKFNNNEQKKEKDSILKSVDNITNLKNYIKTYGGDFYFVGVPNQVSYCKTKYPKYFYNFYDMLSFRDKFMFSKLDENNVKNIDVYKIFSQSGKDDIYFKTDHHCNFDGALMVYQTIINKALKQGNIRTLNALKYDDFNVSTLNNKFIGSRNRQLYGLFPNNDKVKIGYPKKPVSYEKFDNGKLDNTINYVPQNLEEAVSYEVYMGGDKPETIIKTNRKYLDNVLIFGDSYTNAVETLLYLNFNETRSLDLRYYNKKSLYQYIKEYKPNLVIMLRDDASYILESGNGKFN